MAYLGTGIGIDTGLGYGGLGYGGLGYGGLGYGGYGGLGYGGLGYGGLGYGGAIPAIASNERLSIGLNNTVQHHGFANREAIERNADHNQLATHQLGMQNLLATERRGGQNLHAIEHHSGHLGAALARESGRITTNAQQIANQQNMMLAQHDTAVAMAHKDAQLQIANTNATLALQASNNKSDIQKDIAESKNFFSLLSSQQAAAAQLQAEHNNAATNAHITECCCKTESKIVEAGNKIDALILSLDSSKTKEALALSQTANLLLRAGITSGNFA